MSEQDRRELLMAAMEQAEDGTLEAPEEREIEVNDDPIRNEKGQFASKQEQEEPVAEAPAIEEETAVESQQPAEVEYTPTVARPTTWKKEYLPLWDKLDKGENLSPEEARKMLEYSTQRETEYKKGVSAYKAEADNARALTEAISPFVPELQKNGIHPAAWINNLGRAHMILSQAPYQQKVELFNKLAQDYGIDLNSGYSGENTTQYQDPQSVALKQQIDYLNQQVQQVSSWKQQQESSVLMNEIQRFSSDAEKHPHFEVLREKMAQLLEQGDAQDLESAYEQAKWQVPEVREQELKKLTQASQNQITNSQRIAKAKAAAVSPRSVTPNTQAGATDKKDRRSILAEQMGEIGSRV
jgi:hypothetical protein